MLKILVFLTIIGTIEAGAITLSINNIAGNQTVSAGNTLYMTTSNGISGDQVQLLVELSPGILYTVVGNGRFNSQGIWQISKGVYRCADTLYFQTKDVKTGATSNVIQIKVTPPNKKVPCILMDGSSVPLTIANGTNANMVLTNFPSNCAIKAYTKVEYPFSSSTSVIGNGITDTNGNFIISDTFHYPLGGTRTVLYATYQVWAYGCGVGSGRESIYVHN